MVRNSFGEEARAQLTYGLAGVVLRELQVLF